MSRPKQSSSLLDVWLEYENHIRATMPDKKIAPALAQARTALLRYTLPGWGFPQPEGQRLTASEVKAGLSFLGELPVERLKDALTTQEAIFEQLSVPGNSRRNYRWALRNFVEWSQNQPHFNLAASSEVKRSTPRKRQKKKSASDARTTVRKAKPPYKLSESEILPSLQQELDQFKQFLVDAGESHGQQVMRESTAWQYLQNTLRFLGWLHHVKGVPLASIKLQQLVELVPICGKDQKAVLHQATLAAEKTYSLAREYFRWLRTPSNSSEKQQGTHSSARELKIVYTLLALTRFIYRDELKHRDKIQHEEVPAIAVIHRLKSEVLTSNQRHAPATNSSEQGLEWNEFLELVETLRQECKAILPQSTQSANQGTTPGSVRSLTAIAYSYERFLLAAFLAYLPPQRQQVLRSLEILEQTHSNELEDFKIQSKGNRNLIFKENEEWLLNIHPYQQGSRNEQHSLVLSIPNVKYADGRCFYEYLEEWLSYYCYEDSKDRITKFLGLRSCFNPSHSYFFTMKNGRQFSNSVVFAELLRNPAYRITGKVITPHTIRSMYVRHFIGQVTQVEVFRELSHILGYDLDYLFKKISPITAHKWVHLYNIISKTSTEDLDCLNPELEDFAQGIFHIPIKL